MIITLAEVKTYLGLSDTTYDTQITTYLPIIDAKVKLITGRNWNRVLGAELTDSSTAATLKELAVDELRDYPPRSIGQPYKVSSLREYIDVGQKISGTGIPDGAYISDVLGYPTGYIANGIIYDNVKITLSDAATTTAEVEATVGINIAYLPTIAKGVWFLISGESTTLPSSSVESKSVGPVRVSYSDADLRIDGKSGMPGWFVKALPRYHR